MATCQVKYSAAKRRCFCCLTHNRALHGLDTSVVSGVLSCLASSILLLHETYIKKNQPRIPPTRALFFHQGSSLSFKCILCTAYFCLSLIDLNPFYWSFFPAVIHWTPFSTPIFSFLPIKMTLFPNTCTRLDLCQIWALVFGVYARCFQPRAYFYMWECHKLVNFCSLPSNSLIGSKYWVSTYRCFPQATTDRCDSVTIVIKSFSAKACLMSFLENIIKTLLYMLSRLKY